MVKQKIFFYDTGWSELTSDGAGTTITSYTKVNLGNQFGININNTGFAIGKATNASPSLSKQNSTKYYEEGKVQYNSVGNRTFNLSGVINTEVTADQTLYANLIKMVRSPAIFAMKSELTMYGDDPNGAPDYSGTQSEFGAGLYVYVVITNITVSTSADDKNMIDFDLECVLVND